MMIIRNSCHESPAAAAATMMTALPLNESSQRRKSRSNDDETGENFMLLQRRCISVIDLIPIANHIQVSWITFNS
jgi:hypothetical protein